MSFFAACSRSSAETFGFSEGGEQLERSRQAVNTGAWRSSLS